jgi:two-component system response regulator PilR (NtrC family)
MDAVLRQALLVAQSDAPVMILGESGTGKELMARAIHEASPRARHAFVAHNCAAVPGQLMESIFFGHTKGAFTGAVRESRGLFRLAHEGVLFLDEVAELDAALQAKLLRVLEDGRIRAVGGEREIQVDVRLITATSRDLQRSIQDGQFREELYYRTNVLEVKLPPLRDRIEDIPILVDHFVQRYRGSGVARPRFTAEALEFLQGLPWRGNIRELANLVQRVVVLCPESTVDVGEVRSLLPHPLEPGEANSPRATVKPPEGIAELRGPELTGPLARERSTMLEALQSSHGNKSEAARLLGMHRNAFLRRLKRLGVEADRR